MDREVVQREFQKLEVVSEENLSLMGVTTYVLESFTRSFQLYLKHRNGVENQNNLVIGCF